MILSLAIACDKCHERPPSSVMHASFSDELGYSYVNVTNMNLPRTTIFVRLKADCPNVHELQPMIITLIICRRSACVKKQVQVCRDRWHRCHRCHRCHRRRHHQQHHHQSPKSIIINHHQSSSIIINHHQSSSIIINHNHCHHLHRHGQSYIR